MPEDPTSSQLAPMQDMPPGLAAVESTSSRDPQSGAVTTRNVLAQYSIPQDVLMATAIDNMQDKDAQAHIFNLIEKNQAHFFDEDTKAHDRYEARKDAERASADQRKLIITCAGIALCAILSAAVLILFALGKISVCGLVIILSFIILLTLGLCNGSVLNINFSGKTKDTATGVSIRTDNPSNQPPTS